MVSKGVIGGIAVAVIIGIIFAAVIGAYFAGYNQLQANDENVIKKAGDIQTQLQRRYDLIPNLVESVKGYMQFESELLQNITRLRSDWQRAPTVNEQIQTSNQIESALSKILVTYESYPELKTDQSLVRLMDELAGTENRISVARIAYNDAVRGYNIHIRTAPNSFFNENGFIGLKPWGGEPYVPFEATTAAQTTVPQVDLT
jgi:LemA protein